MQNITFNHKKIVFILSFLVMIQAAHAVKSFSYIEGKVSPDNKNIAFICNIDSIDEICLYSVEKDSLQLLTNSRLLPVHQLLSQKSNIQWLDNNKILFLSSNSGTSDTYLLDLKDSTMASVNILSQSIPKYQFDYCRADSNLFYITDNEYGSMVNSQKIGEPQFKQILNSNDLNINEILCSPDGNSLMIYTENAQLTFYNLSRNTFLNEKLNKRYDFVPFDWSSDSKTFLFAEYKYKSIWSVRPNDLVLCTYNIENDSIIEIVNHMPQNCSAMFSSIPYVVGYSDGQTFSVMNLQTYIVKYYDANGRLADWFNNGRSALFLNNHSAYILDLTNKHKHFIHW